MDTSVWRNRHDHSDSDKSLNTVQFSVDKGIVGVNWAVDVPTEETLNWEEYKSRAEDAGYSEEQSYVRSLKAIHDHMKEGDLCYARDRSGQFYLGQITGGWRHETDPEYKKHQLANVRECNWYRIGDPEETVPTKLLESFGRGAVLQRVQNKRLVAFSQRLFELMDDQKHYEIDLPYTFDNWFSDDDLKDLLSLYLQTDEDQILIPSSVDHGPFLADGITINRISGKRTLYHVQHQHDNLPPGAYNGEDREVIYLKRDNELSPKLPNDVKVFQLEDLKSLFKNHWNLLPRRIRIIADILSERGSLSKKAMNTIPSNTQSDDDESRKAATGVTVRNAMYLLAGFLLGLALVTSYRNWTMPSNSTIQQQRQAALETEINDLEGQNEGLRAEQTDLRQTIASMKSAEANRTNEETTSSSESRWINVRVQSDDTLSELLGRFQNSQDMQNEVIERNNIRDPDLIYTGSTLSFPSQRTTDRSNKRMAQN